MINFHESYIAELGFELVIPESAVFVWVETLQPSQPISHTEHGQYQLVILSMVS